ncbi:pectinesterase inhibitor 10-like isoform X1 [Siniperca chuatsi]|uniref:pectinesterase inhibitor 10-like isoform X1 n=1 Tax=Siniperca chuatsi TaxID=119488 RepID=UPI001CE15F00|nr:pectinesterase inhibitor 10-like isoform X1 [Siniperca chuatsi]
MASDRCVDLTQTADVVEYIDGGWSTPLNWGSILTPAPPLSLLACTPPPPPTSPQTPPEHPSSQPSWSLLSSPQSWVPIQTPPPPLSLPPSSLLVPTPPASPPPTDLQEASGDVVSDQTDDMLLAVFIDGVKTVVFHLLNTVLYKYWEEICYSCQINHPSQKHHKCVSEIPEWFYESHFDQLMKRLWTDTLVLFRPSSAS